MSERNPLPACLSHLGQMAPKLMEAPPGYVLVPVELPERAASLLEAILRAGFGPSQMVWQALLTAAGDETPSPGHSTPTGGMTEAQVDLLLTVADMTRMALLRTAYSTPGLNQEKGLEQAETILALSRKVRSASMPVQSAQGSVDQGPKV